MVAATLPAFHSSDPIRHFDLTRDLDPVADLIELCFPIQSDPDGQSYVNQMRKTAREMRLMGWLAGYSDQYPMKSSGFVWDEDGQIVGNLSLIPLQKDGGRVHLIANVAVHPDHRRCGIARKLTQRALQALRQQSETQVWLQVRDDNISAVSLYRDLGFTEQAIRTTWRMRPCDLNRLSIAHKPQSTVRRWLRRDWAAQRAWLETAYPSNVRWQLPLKLRRFSPGLLHCMTNFVDGAFLKHWIVRVNGEFQGVITWQKSDTYANNLWLAFPTEKEAELLPGSLAQVLCRLPKKHPLSIDYPKGRCADQLSALGFEEFRSLIWMVCTL
jgi:ribosomal protein S18 acetylase RimI-like enzyme